MEKRRVGTSDIHMTKLGLGCMSLGTDEIQAQSIIKAAFENGINYFDTADLYDYGVNEKIVGKTLQSVRDEVIIATKVGNRFTEGVEGWSWDPSKKYIKEAVKNSLSRLHTDYIDLYQLHGGTIEDPIDETIEAFEELKSEGYIREYGISSIRPNVINKFLKQSSIQSVMMQYSLLDRRPEKTMEKLFHNHVSTIVRGPVAKGLLTNKALDQLQNKEVLRDYLNYSSGDVKDLLQKINELILEENRKMNDLALQFILANPATTSIVAGASSIEQIIENINSVNTPPLQKEELQLLQKLTKSENYTAHL